MQDLTDDGFRALLESGNVFRPDGRLDRLTMILADENVGRINPLELLKGVLVLKRLKGLNSNLKLTLKVQTAVSGANCPMSEYTRIWLRDTIGPVRAWLQLGAHEDVGGSRVLREPPAGLADS